MRKALLLLKSLYSWLGNTQSPVFTGIRCAGAGQKPAIVYIVFCLYLNFSRDFCGCLLAPFFHEKLSLPRVGHVTLSSEPSTEFRCWC